MTSSSHTCPSCATPLPEAAVFCPHCGAVMRTQDLGAAGTARTSNNCEQRSLSGIGWSEKSVAAEPRAGSTRRPGRDGGPARRARFRHSQPAPHQGGAAAAMGSTASGSTISTASVACGPMRGRAGSRSRTTTDDGEREQRNGTDSD